ncbi:MAG: ANTAR domain-containing protein [Propionicimonas sp.]|nr:ANTAR domain-containing protein [Propionicimonas sp.]
MPSHDADHQRNTDVAWRRAVLAAIQDGVMVLNEDGLVLELNQAFTDLFGYSLDEGPFVPPYPWWPSDEEDPEARAAARHAVEQSRRGIEIAGEYRLYSRDRQPVWVWSASGRIDRQDSGLSTAVRTFRPIGREKAAQQRRSAAAEVSADFGSANDLETVLAVAEHGFSLLFDGDATVRLEVVGRQMIFAGGGSVPLEGLEASVREGLDSSPGADVVSLRPGILLAPHSTGAECRAWVQFDRPRRIGPDELIVADLLAQAFALAVDRILTAEYAADREADLERAVDSHRLIGQAVGILIGRYRLTPGQAFGRLKAASQNRNLKLREVAHRVIAASLEADEL